MNRHAFMLRIDQGVTEYALKDRLRIRPHTTKLSAWRPGTDRIEGIVETDDPTIRCTITAKKMGCALRVLVSIEGGVDIQDLDLRMSGIAGVARIGSTRSDAETVLDRVAQRAARALDALENRAHGIAGALREPTPTELAEAEEAGVRSALPDRVDYLRCAAGRLV